jgi:hypothetical protein
MSPAGRGYCALSSWPELFGCPALIDFLGAVDWLVAACRVHGKPAAVPTGSVETAETRRPRGINEAV